MEPRLKYNKNVLAAKKSL